MSEVPVEHLKEESRVRPVIDRLRNISLDVIGPMLDSKLSEAQVVDPSAGIVLVDLPEAGAVTTSDGLVFHFHGARVLTGERNFVKPHYHNIGEEPYHILSGNDGEMNLGRVVDGSVIWDKPRKVEVGDVIEVQEGQVHSLRNTGDTALDFTFACPNGHLINAVTEHPEGDRFFTMDLPNGVPSHYSK